jgi:HK97 family phage major capsid protein
MTREEVMILDMEGCEERAAKIAEETRDASEEILAELSAELDMIEERKNIIKAEAEEKRAQMQAVIDGEGETIEKAQEEKRMDSKEIRSTKEYRDAFAEYLKANCSMDALREEQRALLTENAENGTIAVPTGVEERINTAWENDEIMQMVIKTYFKGNLKVGYEASATGAVFHAEGGEAVAPQNLVINYAELIPEMAKKVVEVSDEVLASNDAMLDYLYDELEYHIIKLVANKVVQKIVASSLTASYTMAGTDPTTADIVGAEGLLGGEASNPVVITTRATAAKIKQAALAAQFGYDPFDGMRVVYTDAAALGAKKLIVGDLSGVQANFPEGDDAKFKFDDLSKADEDIVRIIGRLYVGIDVVAPGKFVAM